MSRMTRTGFVAIAAIIAASSASAQDLSAEEALASYRDLTKVEDTPRCARQSDEDEIVVCARDIGPSQRLPLPDERGPREGPRQVTGEIPAASAAPMRVGSCGVQATDRCNGGLSIIGAAMLMAKGIVKLIDPEVEFEPPPKLPKQK